MVVGLKGQEIRDYQPKPVAATLIVAASDSLHPERADYLCDGVNDHVEIQGFARALEAYAVADSLGVIDAYIKSPWD